MAAIRDADFEILAHLRYSSDFAPSDLYLFLRLKDYLKVERFKDNEAVAATVQEYLGVMRTGKRDVFRQPGDPHADSQSETKDMPKRPALLKFSFCERCYFSYYGI
ncbi:hypothetical protein EVAR_121_1 [Eumeta japonica]|uniref:Histone-lysine N-methyltransferase SETMAR n=1 Tax=Eumeta variegata TaxID=151549 RepID=A0A4C1S8F3_EUMVA|nr:hypothetical protein EVAR_121_1 [Eumeta japonica]